MGKKAKVFTAVALAVGVSFMTGCASPARVDNMKVSGNAYQLSQETPLKASVAIQDVTGGKTTNPMWTSEVDSIGFKNALEDSLKAVGLYSPVQLGKYRLTAHLLELDQPLFGASMTVTAKVNYVLYEHATGKQIYSRTLEIPYTASFGDALLGVERLRLANEGAVRMNIKSLIDDLFMLKIQNVAIQ